MNKGPKNPERSFGVSVGFVLCLIAAYFFWRGRVVRGEVVGGVGATLIALGLVAPWLLKWPSAIWWRFSIALGRINARILLTLLFSLVLVPLSLFWRITGKDPLQQRRKNWPGWSPYPPRYRDPNHYTKMY